MTLRASLFWSFLGFALFSAEGPAQAQSFEIPRQLDGLGLLPPTYVGEPVLVLQADCEPPDWENCITVTGRLAREDEPIIDVLGTITVAMPEEILVSARPYRGPTFCGNPTIGSNSAADRFFPSGRVNTGKRGGYEDALADFDRLAEANGIPRLGDVMVNPQINLLQHLSPIPTPMGGGYTIVRNPFNGTVSISQAGLTFRTSPPSSTSNPFSDESRIKIDIEAGRRYPNVTVAQRAETCHYKS